MLLIGSRICGGGRWRRRGVIGGACAELNAVFGRGGRNGEGVAVEVRRQLESVERTEGFEDILGDGVGTSTEVDLDRKPEYKSWS
jgi:hypothetical protein